ncbi:RNase H and integrase-like protein, partial [Operophtera brumata]
RVEVKRTKQNRQIDPDWRVKSTKPGTYKKKIIRTETDKYQRLEPTIIRRAEGLLVRASQEVAFAHEIKLLSIGKEVPMDSRLRPLAVELINGTITLKSRIGATRGITKQQKSPAVLDGNSTLAKLFIANVHRKLHHAGVEMTINECRQHYWILRLRPRLADIFWARWLREYLPELQNRRDPHGKGPAIKKGDVVLIADPNLPRNVWPRGLITSTYPGGDGIVRAVDVLTKGGTLRRPTKKLILLQQSESSSTTGVPATVAPQERAQSLVLHPPTPALPACEKTYAARNSVVPQPARSQPVVSSLKPQAVQYQQ